MGSSVQIAGGIAAIVLSGAALTATPSTAQAQSAASGRRFVKVPCSGSALSIAVAAANAIPTTLLLSPKCNYEIANTLQVSGDIALLGGPSTKISPETGFTGRLLDVTTTMGRLRVQGISILDGTTNGQEGTGIRNAGHLVLNFVAISGNRANSGNGAGLSNLQGADALVAHTVISANKATGSGGAGTGSGAGILNRGKLTFFESRLSANVAQDGGGGIDTGPTGTSRFIQSTVDHNFAGVNGGGMFNSGTTSLDRTLVVSNVAGGTGGGIFNNPPGTVRVTRSIIRRNKPNNCAPAMSVPGCTG